MDFHFSARNWGAGAERAFLAYLRQGKYRRIRRLSPFFRSLSSTCNKPPAPLDMTVSSPEHSAKASFSHCIPPNIASFLRMNQQYTMTESQTHAVVLVLQKPYM